MIKTDILSMDAAGLAGFLAALSDATGVKAEKYRAGQIRTHMLRGVRDFNEMTNLPPLLREELAENAYIATPSVELKLVSKIDGTVKYLFRLHDGECVESVFMRYEHGNTLCVSSQVGCRMGCTFCASTIDGRVRDLTASEMLGQIIAAEQDTGERVSNIVMMGIGEPLDNYDNTVRFLKLVTSADGLGIGQRHISVSTCGLCDKIDALAEEDLAVTLSVSLHAPTQEKRAALMPVAKKYDLDTLMASCRRYIEKTGRRVSFEYAMILGKTDTAECAEALIRLLSGLLCHVNLIPLNDVKERSYTRSSREAVDAFAARLEKGGLTVTVRRRLGSDINASCGQLRRRHKENTEEA